MELDEERRKRKKKQETRHPEAFHIQVDMLKGKLLGVTSTFFHTMNMMKGNAISASKG